MNMPSVARTERGLTLIELLTVIAIAAILVAIAAPSFTGLLARKRVEGVVSELSTDLQYARTEAVQRQYSGALSIYGAVATNSTGTCYAVYVFPKPAAGSDPSCDCGSASACAGVTELKRVTLPTGGSGVTVTASTTVSFDPVRGLSSAATTYVATSAADSSLTLSAVVSTLGRVQTCLPSGSTVKGYNACS